MNQIIARLAVLGFMTLVIGAVVWIWDVRFELVMAMWAFVWIANEEGKAVAKSMDEAERKRSAEVNGNGSE